VNEKQLKKQRVAVVIPAKDEARRIAQTVRAAKAIPHVDLVLVVDDGSEDNTQEIARQAGAVVVRHSHNRGKAAAMETGAAVVAMRDAQGGLPRLLLFIDADLAETAVNTAPLIDPVLNGEADMSIALLPPQPGAGGRGIVVGAARSAITKMTGWTPMQPLSGMRCLTREAFEAATPLARGWGVETGLTIDLLRAMLRLRWPATSSTARRVRTGRAPCTAPTSIAMSSWPSAHDGSRRSPVSARSDDSSLPT
jgi:hypothetical protein